MARKILSKKEIEAHTPVFDSKAWKSRQDIKRQKSAPKKELINK